jgi:hypothetical protein
MSHLRQIKTTTRGLLAHLGDSPDEVAETLRTHGVHGVPRDNRSCAVALYLSVLMGAEPHIRSVTVGKCSLMISLVAPADARPAGRLWVQLPKAVRAFVAEFDASHYPEIMCDSQGAELPLVAPAIRAGNPPPALPVP